MKFKILLLIMLFIITGCFNDSTNDYVSKKIGIDVSSCVIEEENDTHEGFHGDGNRIVVFDCSNTDLLNDFKKWKSLPLTDNLNMIIYDGVYNGVEYDYDGTIPKIENGYYYFINRHSDAKSKDDDNIFDNSSCNFTIALYDLDTNKLYYYELDT